MEGRGAREREREREAPAVGSDEPRKYEEEEEVEQPPLLRDTLAVQLVESSLTLRAPRSVSRAVPGNYYV